MKTSHRATICALAFVFCFALPAVAQQRGAITVDAATGWTGFADDGVVSEWPAGVAARWYLTPRVSIGPEFTFISGESHSHRVLTGNLIFDVVKPVRRSAKREGGPRAGKSRLTPFIVIGAGVFNTLESFSFTGEKFSSSEGAFTVGGGVRAPLNDRVSVGADARLGWEPHFRLTAFASARLGK